MGTLDTATSESTRTDWNINITNGTLYLEHGNYRVEYRTGTDYGWKLYDKTYVQNTPAHSSLYGGTTPRYYLPSSLITQANKTITGTASNTPGVETEEIYFDAFTNTNDGAVSCYLPSSPTTKYYLYARHDSRSNYNSGYTIKLAQTSPGNDYHLMYSYTTGNNNTRYIRTSETIATRNNGNRYYCLLRYNNGWRAYYATGNNYALNIDTVALMTQTTAPIVVELSMST